MRLRRCPNDQLNIMARRVMFCVADVLFFDSARMPDQYDVMDFILTLHSCTRSWNTVNPAIHTYNQCMHCQHRKCSGIRTYIQLLFGKFIV
jgi:hypothetical protein